MNTDKDIVKDLYKNIPRQTLETVADAARPRMKFVAKHRVDSEAFQLDRTICRPGDEVEVFSWECHEGPTNIRIYDGFGSKNFCIPFHWVMEMGAPADLATYMPFAPLTWNEILDKPE